jgi:hypothetical protein
MHARTNAEVERNLSNLMAHFGPAGSSLLAGQLQAFKETAAAKPS